MRKNVKRNNDNTILSDIDEDSNYEAMESDHSTDMDEDELQEDTENSSSEEEVLGIHSLSEESDEEIGDSNDDEKTNVNELYDNLIGSKAWGKRKKNFYQSDYATKGNSFQNEDEEEVAKLEEQEALSIQKRLAAEIDNADLTCDLFADIIENEPIDKEEHFKNNEVIEMDLGRMSENEKLNLLKKESPEISTYINDFKKYLRKIKDKLCPLLLLKKAEKKYKNKYSDFWNFIQTMHDIIMTYCTNIVYYILLKLRRNVIKFHPVMNKLLDYKSMLEKLDSIYEEIIEAQINKILVGNLSIDQTFKSDTVRSGSSMLNASSKTLKTGARQTQYNGNKSDTFEEMSENDEDNLSTELEQHITKKNEKRSITYQIAKNKGLTPRRKKEVRNPRVKLRNKYRKAKIRRKGQIREHRKELKRYSGEISGINPNVCRSVSLKF